VSASKQDVIGIGYPCLYSFEEFKELYDNDFVSTCNLNPGLRVVQYDFFSLPHRTRVALAGTATFPAARNVSTELKGVIYLVPHLVPTVPGTTGTAMGRREDILRNTFSLLHVGGSFLH
jgi:hypothetical protein